MNENMSRAGRGALGWSRNDLAREANLSAVVVVKFEGGGNVRQGTLDAIIEAFAANGVTFSKQGKVRYMKYDERKAAKRVEGE